MQRTRASPGRASLGQPQRGEPGDRRQDAETDHERRAGLEPEPPHARLVALRHDRPLVGVVADEGVEHDQSAEREDRRARGVSAAPAAAQPSASAARRTRARPLRRRTRRRCRRAANGPRSATMHAQTAAIVQPAPVARERAHAQIRAQSANVGYASTSGRGRVHRRRPRCSIVPSAAIAAARRRRRAARQEEDRDRRRRHHDRVQVLDRRVGGCGRVDPPGRARSDTSRATRSGRARRAAPHDPSRRSRATAAPTRARR